MIIECTKCQTRAKLPDSKEGAKVRCPECGHVYVARAGGGRPGARKKEDPTKYFLIGGGIVLFAVVAVIASQGGKKKAVVEAAEEVAVDVPLVPTRGFNAPLVVEARELHNFAASSNLSALHLRIDFGAVHAWEQSLAAAAAEGGEDVGPDPVDWDSLDGAQQNVYKDDVITGLTTGRWRELIANWVPYDGDIVEDDGERAIVRVRCHHRDKDLALPDRWVEWRLARDGSRWRAVAWERWVSPEEEKAERTRRARTTVKTTLSDGSEVLEGEVSKEYVNYHEETPQALRDEIEGLIDVVLDLESRPPPRTAARIRLEDIGKHAVPGMLLRIADISPDMGPAGTEIDANFQLTYDQAVQIQELHLILTTITGWSTSYNVHAAMGTTVERQGSGIRQWFGWYDKKFKRFWRDYDAASDEGDPFFDDPDFKPRNEKEAREFEKARREREARGGDG